VGDRYVIKIAAENAVGEVESDTISVLLASVPDTPNAPTSESDGTYMDITMTAPASDGGSTITSYQLQIFELDSWVIVAGKDGVNNLDLVHSLNKTLEKGQLVKARYRAKNFIGWSDYSATGYLKNAGVPSRPPKPTYVSSTSTSITVEISPSESNNGEVVSEYQLWRDGGDYSTTVNVLVATFTTSTQHTVTGLTTGTIYRFGVVAVNDIGDSLMSYYGTFAAATLPAQPADIFKDSSASGLTYIKLYWDSVVSTELSTSGYYLYMAEYGSEDFKLIYDGTNRP